MIVRPASPAKAPSGTTAGGEETGEQGDVAARVYEAENFSSLIASEFITAPPSRFTA